MQTDPDALLDEAIRADNACFEAARRPGVTLAIHLCRGNNRSHWYAEGGYDAIAEKLFSTHERGPFPAGIRRRALGHVRAAALHSARQDGGAGADQHEAAAARERRRARAADRGSVATTCRSENLALSPQCGFASTMEGNLLTEEEQWAKLRLVVETARKVWG